METNKKTKQFGFCVMRIQKCREGRIRPRQPAMRDLALADANPCSEPKYCILSINETHQLLYDFPFMELQVRMQSNIPSNIRCVTQ